MDFRPALRRRDADLVDATRAGPLANGRNLATWVRTRYAAMRSAACSFSWATDAHKANPGGSGFATLASRAGSAFPLLDRIHHGSPSNDFSVSIACGQGMRLHALDRAILGFALDGWRSLKENRAGSHEEMTCEIFPF